MIRKILAISGKPGLYKLISRGNKSLIVETVDEQKKRIPAFGADRVVSLGDISIYTDNDSEVKLASVFESIKQNYGEKPLDLSAKKASQEDIIAFFAKVLPNYDTDRVRVSDMRKVLSWYNILTANGITEFVSQEEETEGDTAEKE
ncbi:MAG: DUF5606 domain-containing protein [Bacteroidaceae bacterium]|nr:DUF5606 domain-containing protein [Bacteroidaceae bacterium]